MRFAARTLMIGVALSCAIGVGAQAIRARAQPSVAVLFRQLQSPKTSEPAEKQLLKLAASDARARRYLADHLPALIEQDPGKPWPDQAEARQEWLSAVNLAGELALVEAAPALTKWMSMRVPFGITSENMEAGLLNSPAGYALYQIGDPAIPAVQSFLVRSNGNDRRSKDERVHAVYVLANIDSPKSMAVLRDYEKNGKDRELANFLRTYLLKNHRE